MLDAGVRLLQFRHKGHFARSVYEQARRIGTLCTEAGSMFVIDDRADIAMLLGAGVHVGQDDLPPTEARLLMGPQALIGYSTHNAAQLQAAGGEPVDYLAIGPVFSTGSKENPDPVLGLEAVRELRKLTSKPLVAIGGITIDTACQLWEAGIDSVAVISALLAGGVDPQSVQNRTLQWLRAAGDML